MLKRALVKKGGRLVDVVTMGPETIRFHVEEAVFPPKVTADILN
jgi:hypothetical protein